MSLITVSLFLSLLVAVLGHRMWRLLQSGRVPGPLLPPGIKGHLAAFMARPLEFGPSMVVKYGPLYRFWTNNLGTQLAVGDPLMAQQLYKDQANMDKPRDGGLGEFFPRFLGNAMGLQNGRKWTNIRKAFKGPMSPTGADKSLENIEATLDQWEHETLEPLARSGAVVSLPELVGSMPIKIMLNVFFGQQFVGQHSYQLLSLARDAEEIMETIIYNKLACNKLYKYLPTKENRTLSRFQKSWEQFLHAYISSKERSNGEGGVVDAVVDYMNSSSRDEITFKDFTDTLTEIIFTNQDVIAPVVSWLFTDLMVYPKKAEALNLTNHRTMIDKSMLENQHPQLLHLIKESGRIHPFFPISLPEVLSKDVELQGYTLPKGTLISVDQYSINFNSNYWSDPSEFMPERFEDVDEFRDKWAVFRFGFGGRRCPGQYLGNLVLANVTARLLSRWRLVPENLVGINHHDQVPRIQGTLTMTPNIKFRIQQRNISKNDKKEEVLVPVVNMDNAMLTSFQRQTSTGAG